MIILRVRILTFTIPENRHTEEGDGTPGLSPCVDLTNLELCNAWNIRNYQNEKQQP